MITSFCTSGSGLPPSCMMTERLSDLDTSIQASIRCFISVTLTVGPSPAVPATARTRKTHSLWNLHMRQVIRLHIYFFIFNGFKF